MFSIYAAAYNIQKFSFNYEKNIRNWCDFVGPNGQVVIAVNTSEDDSLKELIKIKKYILNLELIGTNISYKNNRFDGLIKQAALDKCSCPIRCLMDLDEIFPKNNQEKWLHATSFLIKSPYDGLLIPVLDLWGDNQHIKEQDIGQKFRLHKHNVRRGVWKRAELSNGHFDTSKSDSTEPILADGELAYFTSIIEPSYLKYTSSSYLSDFPFIIHEGYLDFDKRIDINKNFWKSAWEDRSGKTENVIVDKSDLEKVKTWKHGLRLN